MDMARVSMKGQVTIPIAVRKLLDIREGDKVVFAKKNGNVVMLNSNCLAWEEFQKDLAGAAAEAGWESEDDVVEFCKEIRRELWEEKYL